MYECINCKNKQKEKGFCEICGDNLISIVEEKPIVEETPVVEELIAEEKPIVKKKTVKKSFGRRSKE